MTNEELERHRTCEWCEGEEHHWVYVGGENDQGFPLMNCKHCDAERLMTHEDGDDHDQ